MISDIFKVAGLIILLLALILGITWLIQGADFFMYKFWAPKYADAQREVFENTRSFKSGTVQELRKYQLEYERAPDQAHKDALASMIIHTADDYGVEKLPPDLANFVEGLKHPSAVFVPNGTTTIEMKVKP